MKSWTSRRKSLLSGECARVDECARLLLDFIYSSHVRQLAPSSGKMTDQPRSGDGATNCCPAALSQERSCKVLPNPQSVNSTNSPLSKPSGAGRRPAPRAWRAATQPYIPVISPSPAAGGRNDSVHTKIFHHMTVVDETVPHRQRRHAQTRDRPLAERTLHRFNHVLVVDGRDCLMHIGEGVVQIFYDFSFALHRIGSILVFSDLRRGFFAQDRGAEFVIGRRHVFYLLSECAHAFEFAAAGCKGVFVLRHRFRRRYEFLLNILDGTVQNLLNGAPFAGRFGSCLRECKSATGQQYQRSKIHFFHVVLLR